LGFESYVNTQAVTWPGWSQARRSKLPSGGSWSRCSCRLAQHAMRVSAW